MAHISADRVRETSTTTGTGNITVAGAMTGFRSFASVCAVNDTFFYTIAAFNVTEWEVGLGTYTSANVFARTTVLASSNANALVNFTAGDKDVFITAPASRFLQANNANNYGNFSAGTITATLSGNASTVTNGVYTTGDQTIAGNKTLTGVTDLRNQFLASFNQYHYNWGGSQDLNWKTIAVLASTATDGWRGSSGWVQVTDELSNHGVAIRKDVFAKFYVQYSSSGTPLDNAVIQGGPDASTYIRLRKLDVRSYELQVRQPVDWRLMGCIMQIDFNSGSTSAFTTSGSLVTNGSAGISDVTMGLMTDFVNADLLDGQHGSYYLNQDNHTNKPAIWARTFAFMGA